MKGKKKKGNFIFDSVLALLLFAGVSLLLYPTFSNWWNASRQSQAISDYAGKVDEMEGGHNAARAGRNRASSGFLESCRAGTDLGPGRRLGNRTDFFCRNFPSGTVVG